MRAQRLLPPLLAALGLVAGLAAVGLSASAAPPNPSQLPKSEDLLHGPPKEVAAKKVIDSVKVNADGSVTNGSSRHRLLAAGPALHLLRDHGAPGRRHARAVRHREDPRRLARQWRGTVPERVPDAGGVRDGQGGRPVALAHPDPNADPDAHPHPDAGDVRLTAAGVAGAACVVRPAAVRRGRGSGGRPQHAEHR
jgi:hypothetical protein